MTIIKSFLMMVALFLLGFGCSKSQHSGNREKQTNRQYAGSASCRECHADAFQLWSKSHHGLAERLIDSNLDFPAFNPSRELLQKTQKILIEESRGDFTIASRGLSGSMEKHPVARVIGVDPLRQYLVSAPGGRWQAMEAAYDPNTNQWFNVFGGEDRQAGEWGHWSGRGMNWNSMCASCHNTALKKNYEEATDSYHTSMSEPSVACEACHGPLQAHVVWEKDTSHRGRPDPNFPKLTSRQIEDTCASCHSRRGDFTGEFKPGDDFFDHYDLSIVDQSELFYADGQIHDEDYEFTAFLGSKMHAAGVTCLDCHPRSLHMPRPQGNGICLQCHATGQKNAPIIQPESHSHHQSGSKGDECIGCHMPVTVYMQRHPRHDHGFTIPDPQLTKELGIPNACNRCHADKDTGWTLKNVQNWYGQKMNRSTRDRARVINAARQGNESARGPLLKILQTETNYYWQSVGVELLDQWIAAPAVTQAVLEQLTNASPLVREKSIRALEPVADQEIVVVAIRKSLADTSRAVRVAAAWVLRGELDTNSIAGKELLKQLDFNADQPVGQMLKGIFYQTRADLPTALAHFQKAVNWDGNSPPFRQQLAMALSSAGKRQEALEQLEAACQAAPQDADNHFLLALAANETGDTNRTVKELETVVRLNPQHERGWFNLALARSAKGDNKEALAALEQAGNLSPYDPWIPYTRATIMLKMRERNSAIESARQALALQPDFREARELLNLIQ